MVSWYLWVRVSNSRRLSADMQVPVVKATNCLIAHDDRLFPPKPPEMPCIRSAAAAKDTEELIEESRRRAQGGIEASDKVRAVLEEITASVAEVNEQLLGIVEASLSQSEGISEIKTSASRSVGWFAITS